MPFRYEAIDKQLSSFHMVDDQNLSVQVRQYYLKVIEKRQKVLIENLKLSYDQLDAYQKAIDDYIDRFVKHYQNGQLSSSFN